MLIPRHHVHTSIAFIQYKYFIRLPWIDPSNHPTMNKDERVFTSFLPSKKEGGYPSY